MAVATRYLSSLPLGQFGLEWIHPPHPLAHPLDDGSAAILDRSGDRTAERLGDDYAAYRNLIAPVVNDWPVIEAAAFRPLWPPHWPHRPMALARFGMHAVQPARKLIESHLQTTPARSLLAGIAAHSVIPLEAPGSAAIALILAAAGHRAGWPVARGGSQAIADALISYLQSLGGEIVTGTKVTSLADLPPAKAVLCDVSPAQLLAICGDRVPAAYRRSLERFRPGAGVFKLDWALSGPIPWTAPECARAGTLHLGGTLEEIAASEAASCARVNPRLSPRPFVLLSQPSLFDPSRAPAGRHTAWAYCHVPNGYPGDATTVVEMQVERFAPGFRECILARSARGPAQLEHDNLNLTGGDITGGANWLRQVLLRPDRHGYRTPMPGIYLCSASTPPGGGVHGLCGAQAARQCLQDMAF